MNLEEIRKEIDGIDNNILELLLRRMECAKKVAEVKGGKDLPIYNEKREQEILKETEKKAGNFGGEARILFSNLMAMSRAVQHRMLGSGCSLRQTIRQAGPVPRRTDIVACFGQEGSYCHEALSRLYPEAKPLFFPQFGGVFSAVESGTAGLGVIPVENSSAGSVNEVYDLILKYRFTIVGAFNLPVRHCLASCETKLETVKNVVSHPQALRQCSAYLTSNRLSAEEESSTAAAAQAARKPGVAAICSGHAAKTYGLNILARDIQNSTGNRTRFIVISRELIIPESANKISLCFSLPHRTGTLYAVLAQVASAGLNLTKIESRPIPGRNFEYDFYLDFTGNVGDSQTLDLLCSLYDELPRFSFLGNYTEAE